MEDYFFRDSSPPPPPPQRLTESSETFRAQKEPPAEGEFQGKVEQLMWTTDEIQAALLRRARVQSEPKRGSIPEHTYESDYNIWHGKSSRHRLAATRSQKQAVGRCIPSIDTGYSRGSLAKQAIFCLHFARGVCTRGHECMYLHRLPTGTDDAHCTLLYDIFGREKHRNEREDNGGTGSYLRNCRTLFVYYGAASTLGGQRLRQLLATSFGEWGAIEDIHIVPSKCISFVRYKFRASAEFAKEAMMGQKMEDGMEDSLVVRWANDDPNMRAQERVKREREDVVLDGIRRAEQKIPPGQRVALRLVHSFERSLETSGG